MRLSLARVVTVLGLALALPGSLGCAKTISRVAQGEAFTTGTPAYDDFFASLHGVQDDAKMAESDLIAARAPVVKVLGLEEAAPESTLVSETESRVKKLTDAGVLLHLELLPEAKVHSTKPRATLDLAGQDLLKAVDESVRSSVGVTKRLGALALRAAELEKNRTELRAQAPQAFRGEPQARRDEIILELDAAGTALNGIVESSVRNAGLVAKYTVGLALVLETGAPMVGPLDTPPKPGKKGVPVKLTPSAVAAAIPPPAAKKPADPPPAGAAKPPPAAPPAPPPAAPPKKKPAKSDDFEP